MQNCLKPKFPIFTEGRAGVVSQLLMLSPKRPKTQISYVLCVCVGGGGGLGVGMGSMSQLLMLSPTLPETQIPYVHRGRGRGSVSTLLMLSPKLNKIQIPYVSGGGGVPSLAETLLSCLTVCCSSMLFQDALVKYSMVLVHYVYAGPYNAL